MTTLSLEQLAQRLRCLAHLFQCTAQGREQSVQILVRQGLAAKELQIQNRGGQVLPGAVVQFAGELVEGFAGGGTEKARQQRVVFVVRDTQEGFAVR